MKRRLLLLVCALLVFAGADAQKKITVAVAANMQYAIEALKLTYNRQHPLQIDVVLGASGKLTQQIIAGAPFDIFISADTTFPAKVQAAGMAVAGPRNYAQGILVLWTARADIRPEIQVLTNSVVSHIAIANPGTAPYGAAAVSVMKKYQVYDKVAAKLVTGESITQASQYIASGNAEIGFTAKSIVIAEAMRGKGHWVEIKQQDYAPIKQAAVLLKDNAAAKGFYEFVFSAQAKKVFEQFGYSVK